MKKVEVSRKTLDHFFKMYVESHEQGHMSLGFGSDRIQDKIGC